MTTMLEDLIELRRITLEAQGVSYNVGTRDGARSTFDALQQLYNVEPNLSFSQVLRVMRESNIDVFKDIQ